MPYIIVAYELRLWKAYSEYLKGNNTSKQISLKEFPPSQLPTIYYYLEWEIVLDQLIYVEEKNVFLQASNTSYLPSTFSSFVFNIKWGYQ